MVSRMRTETMLFANLHFFVTVLFLLAYIKLVTSGGAGDNATEKLIRCMDNERQALLEFKEALVDDGGILSSWGKNKEEDCCKWKGIRCSNRTGHVTVLEIPGHYDVLTLEFTGLRGKVSPSLLELNHLKYLDLSDNDFGGKIPHQLGNLTNLRYLDLGDSFISPGSTVDNLEWLSHLRLLRHLDLSYVDLKKSTDWLQRIYKLPFLTELILCWCSLPDTKSPLLLLTNSSSSWIPLVVVDLSFNSFNSPTSYNWLFNFSDSLVHVAMSGTSLTGSLIPEAFGSMSSLEYLSLGVCNLRGELPKSFRNLSRLATLDLNYNNFNGKLSEFLHPLAANQNNSLRDLMLGSNQFGGSLPDFTRFPSLKEMSISENKLSGSFPENFGQVSGLVFLDLSTNQITGSFPNLTLFSSLKELYLYNNKLEDTISEAYLSNLAKLKNLDLSFNQLTLKFSFDWAPPFQLDEIILQRCNLGPNFPNWLQSQRNFSALDISSAGINDSIPLWFWDLSPRLKYLSISYNQIQGMLPNLSLKFSGPPVSIILKSNHLKGLIPSFSPNVVILDLSQNMFTGSVSFLCTTAYKWLVSLDLSDNQLSGELPDCWMNVDQLNFLNLANNNLSGKIPTSIGLLNHLQMLQLRNNNFIGQLPSSLKNFRGLQLLDLSENKLLGEVPTWIGTHLTSLIVFSLRKNEFFGSVPRHICHLQFSQVLDLSQNNLSGSIPNCINNLTSLVERENSNSSVLYSLWTFSGTRIYLANALVQWKGVDSEYKKTLAFLKLIDLSSNRLVGKIPQEFASLEGLISLNLSSNNLIGNIIQKIGQMKMLEILDLSKNQLSGKIPIGLASLTFLSVLDLSNNNFTGKIPSSTQLQSFNASVYVGNEELCGLPLPSKCQDDKINVLHPPVGHGKDENNEEDDDRFVTIGFHVSVVLGFATGFWGFLGPILLRSTWRLAYFSLLSKIKDCIYVTTTVNMARLQRKIYGYWSRLIQRCKCLISR